MHNTSEADVLKKIEAGPYFSVRLPPGTKRTDMSHAEASALVTKASVSLRGWDFPHVDPRRVYNADSYVFSVVDWERHVEIWRMYKSGQFVYLSNLWDVSFDLQERLRAEFDREIMLATPEEKSSVVGVTSFIGLIYSVTEFFVFAARLAVALGMSGDVDLRIALHNTERWALGSGDPAIIWHQFYQCVVPKISIGRSITASALTNDPAAIAIPSIRDLFVGFNWNEASDAMVKQWQERLMTGKFYL